MAVVLILSALLGLVASRMKKAGASVGDVGNMRQISVAMENFCQDHPNQGRLFFAYDRYNDNPLPNRYGYGPKPWHVLLRPYFGAVMDDYYTSVKSFISPADPTRGGETTRYSQDIYARDRRSYSFNINTLDPNMTHPRTNSRSKLTIRNPSGFMIFGNHRAAEINTVWIDPASQESLDGIPDDWFPGQSAHFAFLDGHVEMIKVRDVLPGGIRHSIFFPEVE